MRFTARLRPYVIPSLVGLAVGVGFAVLWVDVFDQQPVPLWVLGVIGAAVFLIDPTVRTVCRRRHGRGRPRRAHARPHAKTRKAA
jgi:hypothetical protein